MKAMQAVPASRPDRIIKLRRRMIGDKTTIKALYGIITKLHIDDGHQMPLRMNMQSKFGLLRYDAESDTVIVLINGAEYIPEPMRYTPTVGSLAVVAVTVNSRNGATRYIWQQ